MLSQQPPLFLSLLTLFLLTPMTLAQPNTMTVGRAGAAAVGIGTKIFVAGGWYGPPI